MKLRRNKKGFTIIELVIVIAVIGILAAVLIPTFVNLTNKANEAADNALVNNLNKALKMEEQEPGHEKSQTLEGAIKDLEDQGYILENLASKSGKDLLWSQSENQFLLNTEGKSGKDYWKIVDAVPTNLDAQKYSYYAGKNFNQTDVTVKYGFDAGRIDNIGKVTYVGTGTAQEVAIRTIGGTLTVNALTDKVHHYGAVNVADIQQVADSSYYEHANAVFVKLSKGRFVAQNGSEIGGVHVAANDVIVAVETNVALPTVTLEASVTAFVVETTDTNGEKQTKTNASVDNSGNITLTTEPTETAIPAAVATKIETSEKSTESAAKEKTAEVITPTFDSQYAACIGWTPYNTLKEAFDQAKLSTEPAVVKVLRDSRGNGLSIKGLTGRNITIDFNSFTYDINAETQGSTGTETQALHLEKDNTVTLKNGTLKTTAHNGYMLIQNYCNLTLDNMILDGRNPSAVVSYTLSNNNGNVLIKDTRIIAYEGRVAFDVCRYASYKSVNVTVEGNSMIIGKIELSCSNATLLDGASLQLNGGDFSSTSIVVDNAPSTGFYSVTKAAQVSIAAPAGYHWDNNTLVANA